MQAIFSLAEPRGRVREDRTPAPDAAGAGVHDKTRGLPCVLCSHRAPMARQAIRTGREASPRERERMRNHFVLSSRYEYLFWFWDQAYRLAPWAA